MSNVDRINGLIESVNEGKVAKWRESHRGKRYRDGGHIVAVCKLLDALAECKPVRVALPMANSPLYVRADKAVQTECELTARAEKAEADLAECRKTLDLISGAIPCDVSRLSIDHGVSQLAAQREELATDLSECREKLAKAEAVSRNRREQAEANFVEGREGAGVPVSTWTFEALLRRQRGFSRQTFGEGQRTRGIVEHLAEESQEVIDSGHDIHECVDVLILALDLCWRSGCDYSEIESALLAKMKTNEERNWPPAGSVSEDQKINHDRSSEPPTPPAFTPDDEPLLTMEKKHLIGHGCSDDLRDAVVELCRAELARRAQR